MIRRTLQAMGRRPCLRPELDAVLRSPEPRRFLVNDAKAQDSVRFAVELFLSRCRGCPLLSATVGLSGEFQVPVLLRWC